MRSTAFRILTAPVALAALSLVFAAPAQATPPDGVTAETLAQFQVPGAWLPGPPPGHAALPGQVTATLRRIVIAPGGSTGWHHHPGHVTGVVTSGTLTRELADCSRETSPAGSPVSEDPGGAHVGRNLGTEPVVLQVLYLLPEGAAFSIDSPAACP